MSCCGNAKCDNLNSDCLQTAVQPTARGFVQGYPSRLKLRARGCLRASIGATNASGASNFPLKEVGSRRPLQVVCKGLGDFVGGDLLGFDLDKWADDVEKFGSLAVYPPAEGGYEGRYCTRLKADGYHFMNISARGLGDPEVYLTKVHGVRPVRHLSFFLASFRLQNSRTECRFQEIGYLFIIIMNRYTGGQCAFGIGSPHGLHGMSEFFVYANHSLDLI